MSMVRNDTRPDEQLVLVSVEPGLTVIEGNASLKRLNYFEGKFLRADDLRLEQDYARTLADTVARGGGAGIVHGFDTTESGNTIVIGPGLAFDSNGRPLMLGHTVNVDVRRLIEATSQLHTLAKPPAPGKVVRDEGTFGDCVVAHDDPATTVVAPGTSLWLVSIGHAEAYCGVEDVYGRLCEDACITDTERPFLLEGIVIRATPLQLRRPLPAPHGVHLDRTHLRSMIASSVFAAEAADGGSLISGSGLTSETWCLGATADARRDVALAVVARLGDTIDFLDAWTVRRERIEAPARRYWAGRMRMRPLDVFLAQVLQFQCQLHERPSGGGPLGTGDPCAPHHRLLDEASGYLAEIERLAAATPDRPAFAGGIAGLADLRDRIAKLVIPAPQPDDRVLISRGFVELPSAGYLPVAAGQAPTVNDQARALLGPGVDVRVCIVRPDFVAHALEEAQHMDRISLLEGLDQPDRRPRVDVLVPDGERIEIVTHPPGRGFTGVVRVVPGVEAAVTNVPPTRFGALADVAAERIALRAELAPGIISRIPRPVRESAVAVRGAGRGEAEQGAPLAFHFAGAAAAPTVLDVETFAHALAAVGSVQPSHLDLFRGLTLTRLETPKVESAFFTRMTGLAAEALRATADLRAARPVFEPVRTHPPIDFKPPVPPHEAAVVNLWLSVTCDVNPLTLGPGQSTGMRLVATLALPSEHPSLLRYQLRGDFQVTSPPPLGIRRAAFELPGRRPFLPVPRTRRIQGHFSGVGSVESTVAGVKQGSRSGTLELDATIVQDVLNANVTPSISIALSRPDDAHWNVKATWGGDPLHLQIDAQQGVDDKAVRLASITLDANDDVLVPGNADRTIALSALEVISAATGDAEFASSAAELLFPPAPPPPEELIVGATTDWVLFHRRRDKECGEKRAVEPAVARRYQLFHVEVPDVAGAEKLRRALLQNDVAAIAAARPEPVDQVEFAAGLGNMRTNPDAVRSDWQAQQPGRILQYALLASQGQADGDALAQSRLWSVVQAVASISAPADDLVSEQVPYVAAPLLAPGADGAIVLVTRALPTACHALYRLKPETATRAAALIKKGDVKSLLTDQFVTPFGEAEFLDETGELVSDRTALRHAWDVAGGGTPIAVTTMSKKDDQAAGPEGARLDRAAAVAVALQAGELARTAAYTTGDLGVHCPVVTIVVPKQQQSTARLVGFTVPASRLVGPLRIPFNPDVVGFVTDRLDTAAATWPAVLKQLQEAAAQASIVQLVLAHAPGASTDLVAGANARLASFVNALSTASPAVSLAAGVQPTVRELTVDELGLLTTGQTVDELLLLRFAAVEAPTECQAVYRANPSTIQQVQALIEKDQIGAAIKLLESLGEMAFKPGGSDAAGDLGQAVRGAWGAAGAPATGIAVVGQGGDAAVATKRAQGIATLLGAPASFQLMGTHAAAGPLPIHCGSLVVLLPTATPIDVTTRTARVLLVDRAATFGAIDTNFTLGAAHNFAAAGTGGPVPTPTDLVVSFADDALVEDAAFATVESAIHVATGGTAAGVITYASPTADAAAQHRLDSLVAAFGTAAPPIANPNTQPKTIALDPTMEPFLTASGVTVDDLVVLEVVADRDRLLSLFEVASDAQLEMLLGLVSSGQAADAGSLAVNVARMPFQAGTATPMASDADKLLQTAWTGVSNKPPRRMFVLQPDSLDAAHVKLHQDRAQFAADALKAPGVDPVTFAPGDAGAPVTSTVVLALREPRDAGRTARVVGLRQSVDPAGTPLNEVRVPLGSSDIITFSDADPNESALGVLLATLTKQAAKGKIVGVEYEADKAGTAGPERTAANERANGFVAMLRRKAATALNLSETGAQVNEMDAGNRTTFITGTNANDLIIVHFAAGP